MRALICGGRDFDDKEFVFLLLDKLNQQYNFSLIITGGARGADFWAHMWASHNKKEVKIYEADWDKHGKSAGMIRNREMLRYAHPEVVIAFPGERGTADMVKISKKAGVEVVEVLEEDYEKYSSHSM